MKKNYLFTMQDAEFRADDAACRDLLSKLSDSYDFADIDYSVDHTNEWCWTAHTGRLAEIAANLPFLEDSENRVLFLKVIDRFLEAPRVNTNWWHNEIGLPINCGKILLNAEALLSDRQKEELFAYVKNGSLAEHPEFLKRSGANQLWGVTATIGHSLFVENMDLLREPLQAMKKELSICQNAEEGIQPDYSFLQHYTQFYSGGYGYSFLLQIVPIIYALQGTELQFSPEELGVLAQYMICGMRYVIYHDAKDMLAVGRELTRPDSGKAYGLRGILSLLVRTPEMSGRDVLQQWLENLDRGGCSWQGDKYFSNVNYYVSRTMTSHIGCRCTTPNRSLGETFNGENFFSANEYAGGATCIMIDGKEYLNIFPVFDFSNFPGTTAPKDDDEALLAKIPAWYFQNGANAYCGGMSCGTCGLMYQDLNFDGLTGVISRFFADGILIALGAGISHTSEHPLFTTLNQCWQRGEVVTEKQGLPANTVIHDRVAYLSLDGQPIQFTGEERSGAWQRINQSCNLPPVTGRVCTLTISHGVQPDNAFYAYAVVPLADPLDAADQLEKMLQKITVIRNDSCVQAVQYEKQVFCVFHQRDTLILPDGRNIESSMPAGYILE